ncbi:MAG TPA: signal peptidase I [Acidimicrobiales bacterium]|nr:signal peptidase I [Acidimicrobiales bacterium]
MPEETVLLDKRGSGRRQKRPHSRRRQVIEWVVVIVAAVLTAVVLRAQVVQAFEIPSLSMAPTLLKGDRVLVNKLSYRLHDVNRGDVIVFKRPPNSPDEQVPHEEEAIKDLIKRVVALPGERVSSRDGKLLINGRPIDEPYLPTGTLTNIEAEDETLVPPGQYWVMGDNRQQSKDSRFFGTIQESSIIGRAFVRMWPINHWGGL